MKKGSTASLGLMDFHPEEIARQVSEKRNSIESQIDDNH